jgi:hypothetical protein
MSYDKEMAAAVLRILHGARSLPPAQAVQALKPFLESMGVVKATGDKLADESADSVMALVHRLKENQAASDDEWQKAIETTLSYANDVA